MDHVIQFHSPEEVSRHLEAKPSWIQHAIWWHVYPLGFLGAPSRQESKEIHHRLPHLIEWFDYAVELGVSGLLLGPIFSASTHGYDTVDYFQIDPRLGDFDDFTAVIQAAHARGLRVLLDGVFNHVGSDFPKFQTALSSGAGSPESAWFRSKRSDQGSGADATYETFEGHESLIALNHESLEVTAFVQEVMLHWLNAGIDGWRLDAAYAVPPSFWSNVLPEVRNHYPGAYFFGEVIHGDYADAVNRGSLDSVTQYELWKALWSSINDRNWFELAWALNRHNEYLDTFVPVTFVGNHDVTRIASQIEDVRHLEHAIVILFTVGGTPCIYYGDEQAFRGIKEQRAGGDDAIRPEFPEQGPAGLAPFGWETYRLHQQLTGLRRRNPWLHSAKTTSIQLSNTQFLYRTEGKDRRVIVALNLDDQPMAFSDPGATKVLLGDASMEPGGHFAIPPHRWAIFE
jgi:cyclomaltodextrinase / maltogenic alpha-amylase / neopullulanase